VRLKGEVTYADETELLDVFVVGLDGVDVVGDLASDLGRGERLEELAQLLLLLLVVRRVAVPNSQKPPMGKHKALQNSHLNGAGLSLEPIRDVDLVLLMGIAKGEDIRALKSLVKVAEDIEDDDDCLVGIGRASDVCEQ
jgi:hypothetical protein